MFARHFHDNLAGFADALRPATAGTPADAIDATQLTQADTMDALLDRFGRDRGSHDRRATASQWSKYFFSRLIIPVTVAQLAQDSAFDLSLSRLAMNCHDDGTPDFFTFAAAPTPTSIATAHGADFASLIDDALTPLVANLCRRCRLSPRVFWSNAVMYFAWALGELEVQGDIPGARLASARALLDTPARPDGGHNPFYRPYKACRTGALDGDDTPIEACRRLCCMRDLDPIWGLCANCPRAVYFETARNRATG